MKHCILATDLALFFPNKARLGNIVKENTFSWDIPDHRLVDQSFVLLELIRNGIMIKFTN